uniref:Cuticle protein 16.5 n=1 Tax=Timema cristinae TaxID=61476 RepID=A0A7R9H494_TIMCR|nr:unnamed protein product [Timema cristinae]
MATKRPPPSAMRMEGVVWSIRRAFRSLMLEETYDFVSVSTSVRWNFNPELAVLAVLAVLAGSTHGGAVPVAAPLAVASFGSSYTAHSVNHALAQPVALPAVAKYAASPLIAAAPYATAPYVAAPYASAPYVAAAQYAAAPYVASPYATTPLRYSAAFPSHATYLAR